ncbi:MAG: AAA family ATPase, partial [Polyangia bacterium]
MVTRDATKHLNELAANFPVVAITGPRQSGKTTLARMAFPDKPYVSLENPDILWAATQDPRGFLQRHQ